jgi:hypothetical protein
MGALSVRYWTTRNLAFNAGLAFAVGGGRDGSQALDTYLGVGPVLGAALLLGNWHHLAVRPAPGVFVWFTGRGRRQQPSRPRSILLYPEGRHRFLRPALRSASSAASLSVRERLDRGSGRRPSAPRARCSTSSSAITFEDENPSRQHSPQSAGV